uniref:ABC transporter permease n=1 Tax=Mycetocola sp. TaxID=1871042 RepID=UPI00398A445A
GDGARLPRPRRAHPWPAFLLRRVGGLLLSFFVLVVVTFLIIPLIPGDPAQVAAGDNASPAEVEAMRQQLGLDLPLFAQFADYVGGVLSLDLGNSFINDLPVTTIVLTRLPYTAAIAFLAIAIVLVVSVPLGMSVAVATRGGRRRWLDGLFNFGSSVLYSVPQYVMATLLVFVFAVSLRILPAAGAATFSSLVLPTAALTIGPICVIARIVRRETSVVLEKDYLRTARGWRLSTLRTHARYVLPNLVTTTLTLSGLILAGQLGGAVIIETVFGWPGLGLGIVNAITQRDYPVIRGIILVLGLLATLIITLVDVILAAIDPRNLES